MAISLIKSFKEIGFDVGFCKPISGINGWYQFNCIEESLKLGFLVGEDLIKLHEACESSNDLRVEGAIVSVVFPPDPVKIDFRVDYYSIHNPVIVRILNDHYYFPSSLNLLSEKIAKIVKKMIERFDAKEHSDFNELFENGLKIAEGCLEDIKHDIVIVESYSNVATPLDSLNYDFILTVMPCKAVIIKGDDFKMAVKLYSSRPSFITVERILEIVKAVKIFDIPPKRSIDTAMDIVSFLSSKTIKLF